MFMTSRSKIKSKIKEYNGVIAYTKQINSITNKPYIDVWLQESSMALWLTH